MSSTTNRGVIVTAAATGINLALGVLYTWSIFKGAIKESIIQGGPGAFNWDIASINDPYALCCLVFAFAMIAAGKCQDVFGPRKTAIIGGILVGLGFTLISQTTSYLVWLLGFGGLVGIGLAFGYSSATPPAMKWFPPNKTGKIAGIVVSGFGLASVYIAPLSIFLVNGWGLQKSMLFFGIGFFIVVSSLAMLLKNPPAGYIPQGFIDRRCRSEKNKEIRAIFNEPDATASQIVRKPSFWLIWTLYFIGAGAGLMVIGSIAGMAKKGLGDAAFWAVALLAIGNAAGRIVAGMLSDKIGRRKTLAIMLSFQALLMFLAIPITSADNANILLILFLSTFIGFNYGTNLAIFPSLTKDLWGLKNFGVNYGLVFTAWGTGGFVMSKASQLLVASTGNFNSSFLAAGVLLILGTAMTPLLKNEKGTTRRKVVKIKQKSVSAPA